MIKIKLSMYIMKYQNKLIHLNSKKIIQKLKIKILRNEYYNQKIKIKQKLKKKVINFIKQLICFIQVQIV